MDKKFCNGCEQNFYNGNNPYGVKECWSLKDATRARFKLIHVDQPPPYNHIKAEWLPTCYSAKRFVKVKPEALTEAGFWKR